MAINYPLQIPAGLGQSSIQILEINRCAVTNSPTTLKSQAYEYGGQGWGLRVSIDAKTREEAAPWIAFRSALYGKKGTFQYGDVLWASSLATPGGSPKVAGGGQKGVTLLTDGWTPSTQVLAASDMIQIDTSLYRVLSNVLSDGSGLASLDLWPMLRTHADNSDILYTAPKGLFRLSTNEIDNQTADQSRLYYVEFEAEEAL